MQDFLNAQINFSDLKIMLINYFIRINSLI